MKALTPTQLRSWLATEAGLPASVGDDTPLFSDGRLDSLLLIDLIRWLEDTTGVSIAWHEVTLDNLDTVARILAFVSARQR